MGVVDPLFDPAIVESPHEYYAELREQEPVHLVPGTGTYLVTSLELVHQAIADVETFSSRSNAFLNVRPDGTADLRDALGEKTTDESLIGSVLATADPPEHGRQRRVLSKVLSAKGVMHLEVGCEALVNTTLDRVLDLGRVEWMSELAESLPAVMVARLLGLPDDTATFLKETGFASVEQISGFVPDEQRRAMRDRMVELGPVADAYMRIRSGEEAASDTILAACADAVAQGEMDDFEAFTTLMLIVAAGTESTTSLLGTGIRLLAEDASLQERLRRAPDLIPTFVEEACRYDPPFRGHYRRVTRDTTLGGVDIPAGSRTVLVWPAANRDPAGFTSPEEIDLDRPTARQHVGFGWGIHLCIGAPLARLEARVAFARLLARTKDFTVDRDCAPLRHHRSLMVRRLEQLPLLLTPA